MSYFDSFPMIEYDGVFCKNILTRVDLTEASRKDPYLTFDYQLEDSDRRTELLAHEFYNEPSYDWTIFMANDVIDPYYDVYLHDQDFKNYLIKKYGSVENASNKIAFYRTNWYSDESSLTISGFDLLPSEEKVYWQPELNSSGQIFSYTRRKEDWIRTTNQIINLTVTSTTGFEIGDRVHQEASNAFGEVVSVGTSTLMLQHIDGEFITDSFITAITIISNTIPAGEIKYWSSVTAYDHENEINERKRYISMIRPEYINRFETEFKKRIDE